MSINPQRKYRADYRPPAFLIDHVALDFDIRDDATRVQAEYQVRRNPAVPAEEHWRLDGRGMTLESVAIDSRELAADDYALDDTGLTLRNLPERFRLRLANTIHPDANLALEGLYRSDAILCTQCEATGFSRITYFPDRPDIMARYSTRISADATRYPVLLSNGNCIETGDAGVGRHYAVFEDPFAKPCYLFALVAGDLGLLRDRFVTASGRSVDLLLYTEHGNEDQCHHAMDSLKRAMAWDEATYGLEYDLDAYVTVAVGSFNMGAMENKGLNIFNTACIFARTDTATDADFARVRDVVAHEYFHNYTGNRVTCRDWFQLSLKEGLTVFREHQFAIDHGSSGVTRIEQVRLIREVQFPEDAGPRAHPVRPESYLEMNNFYTITVYEKGAEVIRMMEQMAGRDAFIKGVRHYLQKHDGQAVTIEDFVVAIEESTGLDLARFRHWYAYAGTPELSIDSHFENGALVLDVTQTAPAAAAQGNKPIFDIPVAFQLFDAAGAPLGGPDLRRLTKARERWRFEGCAAAPTVSALRGFTAPVRLSLEQSESDLARLMAHDNDPVSRWDAAQSLYLKTLVADVEAILSRREAAPLSGALGDAVEALLAEPPADRALLAEMLTLPSETRLGDEFAAIDVAAVSAARRRLKRALAERFADRLQALCDAHAPTGDYVFNVEAAGRRRVFALALDYLAELDTPGLRQRALAVYEAADNMTDRMAALRALLDLAGAERDSALADFAARFADYPLVMDKWRALQAESRCGDSVARVRSLLADPALDATNPNRVRSLLWSFARRNLEGFHRPDGAGYALIADEVLRLDPVNPQLAAGIVGLLAPWRRYAEPYAAHMRAALGRVSAAALSANTREIVTAGLGSA